MSTWPCGRVAARLKLLNLFNKYNKNIISLIILLLVAKFQGNMSSTPATGVDEVQQPVVAGQGRF